MSFQFEPFKNSVEEDSLSKVFFNKKPISKMFTNQFVPFGIEQYYQNFILKINLPKNSIQEILDFEKDLLESYNQEHNTNYTIKSQIRYTRSGYDNQLMTYCKQVHKKITTLVHQDGEPKTVFDVTKRSNITFTVSIYNLYIENEIIYYKWKIDNITILNN